jgi:hypothetical protein
MFQAPLNFERPDGNKYCDGSAKAIPPPRASGRESFSIPPTSADMPMTLPPGSISYIKAAQAWKCVPNINVPLRLNARNEVECMSTDGQACNFQGTAQQCRDMLASPPSERMKPLACGDMHKQIHGYTGYDRPEHWCAQGFNELHKM